MLARAETLSTHRCPQPSHCFSASIGSRTSKAMPSVGTRTDVPSSAASPTTTICRAPMLERIASSMRPSSKNASTTSCLSSGPRHGFITKAAIPAPSKARSKPASAGAPDATWMGARSNRLRCRTRNCPSTARAVNTVMPPVGSSCRQTTSTGAVSHPLAATRSAATASEPSVFGASMRPTTSSKSAVRSDGPKTRFGGRHAAATCCTG